jgi:hypothetical protein
MTCHRLTYLKKINATFKFFAVYNLTYLDHRYNQTQKQPCEFHNLYLFLSIRLKMT